MSVRGHCSSFSRGQDYRTEEVTKEEHEPAAGQPHAEHKERLCQCSLSTGLRLSNRHRKSNEDFATDLMLQRRETPVLPCLHHLKFVQSSCLPWDYMGEFVTITHGSFQRKHWDEKSWPHPV